MPLNLILTLRSLVVSPGPRASSHDSVVPSAPSYCEAFGECDRDASFGASGRLDFGAMMDESDVSGKEFDEVAL